jgi:hypothetical protein
VFGNSDGYKPPPRFTLFASALFAFSGLFNVILYFSTRKEYAVGPSVTATATILPLTTQDSYLPQPGQIPGRTLKMHSTSIMVNNGL